MAPLMVYSDTNHKFHLKTVVYRGTLFLVAPYSILDHQNLLFFSQMLFQDCHLRKCELHCPGVGVFIRRNMVP